MSGQENNIIQEEDNTIAEQETETAENTGEAAAVVEETEQPEMDIETLKALLEKEKEHCRVNHDAALRAQAEMDNLRKRTARDIENAHKFALEKFVNELLPVMDSLSLGIGAAESAEQVTEIREGMDLTLKMFIGAIEKFGVKEIDPLNEKFNPEQHEAVSMQEIEGTESGSIATVIQKGYQLNGRLVRPAMVVVAK